jgi:4-hydroxy-4-methyl-2-oxoglutarate aldolase
MSGAQNSTSIERLARLDSCAISDSLDKLGLTGAVTGLSSLSTSRRISGRVITVRLVDARLVSVSGGPVPHLGARAIERAQAGDVVVIEQRTGIIAGAWGGILSTAAKLRGMAGVICDGLVRDVDEARGLEFPIYARGATALTARGRVAELETGGSVRIGEIAVCNGDYVIADATAVVFIAAAQISTVLNMAEEIAAREAAMSRALMEGVPVTHVMGTHYEEMLKR